MVLSRWILGSWEGSGFVAWSGSTNRRPVEGRGRLAFQDIVGPRSERKEFSRLDMKLPPEEHSHMEPKHK